MDYQILIEADFLVNASESNFSKVSIENAKSRIFKTAAGCSDPLYRRASRVSMGTVFQIPWTFIRDSNEMRCKREVIWPKQVIAELKKLGYKTAALALTDDSVSIDDSELMKEEKLAVILGNEVEGLENETIALCDYTVKIPMTHGVDSLNVAAASAVAFWQLGKIIL